MTAGRVPVSDEATVQQVLQAEHALYQAMIAKDYAAFERILSPSLVYVHSTAVAESKQEYQLEGHQVKRVK